MTQSIHITIIGLTLSSLLSMPYAQEWVVYQNSTMGLAMTLPSSMQIKPHDFGNGWTGITTYPPFINALMQKKVIANQQNILSYAATLAGVPLKVWQLIDQDSTKRGWVKYSTYQATDGTKALFVILGNSSECSYIVFLSTTVQDLRANQTAYTRWYDNITLIPITEPTATDTAKQPATRSQKVTAPIKRPEPLKAKYQ